MPRIARLRTGTARRAGTPAAPETTVLLRELVAQNQTEIGRADGKAAVLLATAGSLLGLLLARRPTAVAWETPLWWGGTASAAGALFALLLAVVPRRGGALRDGVRLLAYFEDVVRAGRGDGLPAALRGSAGDPEARLIRALEGTSRIAHAKNRCIRWAVVLLLPALTAVLGVLVGGG